MPNKLFQLKQSHYFWTAILDNTYKRGFKADITSNFDYETSAGEKYGYI